ncbi:hypothetical protein [Gilliamella sp. Imp1-1]|nr:hypothetical protein [Gilliamella apicola]KDN09647.1 hypothetical protein GAPWKB30_1750 [Gilliamella apicola]
MSDSQKQKVLRLCKQRALKRRYLLSKQQQQQDLNPVTPQFDLNF